MTENANNPISLNTNENTNNQNANSGNDYQSQNSNSSLSEGEENQQETASNNEGEGDSEDDNKTPQAADAASNTAASKLAGNRRDASEVSSRANEATDRNDSGSGGISAGGVKSGSSLQ